MIDGQLGFLPPALSAVVCLWPTLKLGESQLPSLQSCLSRLKEMPSRNGSKEDRDQRNRETRRRSNSTASSTEVDASRRGIGFLGMVRRIFNLKDID